MQKITGFLCLILIIAAGNICDGSSPATLDAHFRSILAEVDLANEPTNASDKERPSPLDMHVKEEKPPLAPSRIAVEILAGAGLGIAAMIPGSVLGNALITDTTCDVDTGEVFVVGVCINWGAFYGPIIGYCVGSAFGVYLVGDTDDETGSFWATLAGSALGTLAFILPAPIGAAVGFNLTRKYKEPSTPETGLINIKNGQMSLALPEISARRSARDEAVLVYNLDLLKVRF